MEIYKRLLAYIRPYRWRLFGAVVCMFLFSVANSLVSATLYVIINGLHHRDQVILKNLPHFAGLSNVHFPVQWVPFIIFGVFFLRGLFDYISNYLMAGVGIRAIKKVREDLYEHLVRLSSDFYARGRTGDFLSRILNDVGSIQGAITDVIVDLFKQPFVILFNVPWVFIWGGKSAFFALLIFPLVAIPITWLGKNLRRTTKKMQERAADITAFIGETLSGIHVVKAFNREDEEIRRFQSINRSVFEFFKSTIRITLIQRPLIEILGSIGVALAVWFGIQYLEPDRFVAFVGSLYIFYEPLKKISKVNSTIQQSIAAGARIFEIIDAVPSVKESARPVSFADPVETITYQNVSFGYAPGKKVLDNIHFTIRRGEVFALVGLSGSGKTTLVNLLERFYDPTNGEVLINGKDIRTFSLKSLRNLIGIVSQETILFNTTVRANIAYGRMEASLEEVERAAKAAHAGSFIEALSEGYDTILGERGLRLSGGQRQRIAIARAILKNPPILIFDEATSHLDNESEREVQLAIEDLMKGRTTFVIAHRLSTVQKADRILVLDQGRIVEEGTHETLLKEGAIYRRLYDLQFRV